MLNQALQGCVIELTDIEFNALSITLRDWAKSEESKASLGLKKEHTHALLTISENLKKPDHRPPFILEYGTTDMMLIGTCVKQWVINQKEKIEANRSTNSIAFLIHSLSHRELLLKKIEISLI